jgi:glycosyltransferase involved in cell wall biosynthesis
MAQHYAWADVFLLPSICEGSATVIFEALATGLPVICTKNAGSVVRDGEEGFIVPVRDANQIVERLGRFVTDSSLWHEMSEKSLRRAREFTLEKYAERLIASITGAFEEKSHG